MDNADLIIVGGGIFGCAIAYYFSRDNPGRRVVLLERNSLNSGATSRAAALMTIIRPKESYIPLSLETYRVIPDLEQLLQESLGLTCPGMLHVAASGHSLDALNDLIAIAARYGRSVVFPTAEELQALVPGLKTDEIFNVALMEGEGFCDPFLLGMFFARCAEMQGVQIKQRTAVTRLIENGGRIVGVETLQGNHFAPVVVDAAGVWATQLAKQVGVGLPMAAVRSQYWITERTNLYPSNMPMVLLPDAQAYLRPESGALLIGIRERQSMVVSPDDLPDDMGDVIFSQDEGYADLAENGPKLARFFPAFSDAAIKHYLAGFSGYTPDGHLVLGGVPGLEGLLVASGCCGAGISVAGGVGLGIASIAAGKENPFNFSDFGL
nr:FAD-dependent oxidoreductase [Cytophagales bacterium]